jgi:FAD/FMN-containing dehydrogenase
MPIATEVDVGVLRGQLRGPLLGPGDEGYEDARAVWNASIDRRPALIARCTGAADVIAAVRFAGERGILTAVRGGGHNVAGLGTCDDGLVIDCSPMKGIRVDPARRLAVVQPGVVWGELDRETQAFGLATPGGFISTTGIAGFTLGGGFGWLSRSIGLAADNLVAADVVTADGTLIRATPEQHADLLWGLKGGGGNFGVVTAFEYTLHEIGPTVLAGPVLFRAEDTRSVLAGVADLVARAPDELFIGAILRRAPAAQFIPSELHGRPVAIVGACWSGSIEDGTRAVAPVRELAEPLLDLLEPRPYVEWQSMMDGGWAAGARNYWKAEYIALDANAVEACAAAAERITSPASDIKIGSFGGAIARVEEGATAFGHRSAPFILNINSRWNDALEDERHVRWARDLWAAVQPSSAGGVYVNFLGEEGHERVRAAYGDALFDRLVTLKRRYDPTNFFRVNQNIPPEPLTPPRTDRS